MIKVRNGTEFSSGMVSVGFWLGLTLGRVILGFITPYLKKQRVAVTAYLVGCIAMQLVFYTVNNFVSSAIAVTHDLDAQGSCLFENKTKSPIQFTVL